MLDYYADIVADLRVVARVDDWRELPGPDFFALVFRLPLYGGALARALLRDYKREQAATPVDLAADPNVAELVGDGWLEM